MIGIIDYGMGNLGRVTNACRFLRLPAEILTKPGRVDACDALIFPGQGSQHAGMGRRVAERSPAARAVFNEASEILKFDVAAMVGPDDDDDPIAFALQDRNSYAVLGLIALTLVLATYGPFRL